MTRKYESEIESLLSDLFRDPSWTKEEWVQFRRTIFTKSGITYDELEKAIDKGVEQGFTVQQQIIILKKQFQNLSTDN